MTAKTAKIRGRYAPGTKGSCIAQARALGVAWDVIYTHDWTVVAVLLDAFGSGADYEQLIKELSTQTEAQKKRVERPSMQLLETPHLSKVTPDLLCQRGWANGRGRVRLSSLVMTKEDLQRCTHVLTDRARLLAWHRVAVNGRPLERIAAQVAKLLNIRERVHQPFFDAFARPILRPIRQNILAGEQLAQLRPTQAQHRAIQRIRRAQAERRRRR
jgi:hypothetical protein